MLLALLLSSAAFAWSVPEELCTWKDARWEQWATLRLPGSDRAFAEASGSHGKLVRVSGALGTDMYGEVRFGVTIEGQGLSVQGEIDPNDDAIFHLLEAPLPLGEVGILVKGAHLAVLGGEGDALIVGAHPSSGSFRPRVPATSRIPCERVSIYDLRVGTTEQMLAAAGFPSDAPQRHVDGRSKLRLLDEPGGRVVGVLPPSRYPRGVRLIEERDGYARVALPQWNGTIWYGWVDADRVVQPDQKGGFGGLLGALASSNPVSVHRCAQDLDLFAAYGPMPLPVGRVKAGVAIEVLAEHGATASVAFPNTWLRASEGAELRVLSTVLDCPADTLPARPGLDSLFGAEP